MRPSGKLQPAVFLDRDGVINRAIIHEQIPYPPRRPEELEILDGVKEAVSLLHNHGFITVVVTNQPDIARGVSTLDSVLNLHKEISSKTGLQNFYLCVHDERDECECRKPNTGLIKKAVLDLDLDVSKSFMVGDRWKDIEAGQRVGCRCFYIDNNYLERRPIQPFQRVTSLLEAAIIITEGINAK
jgi:D-glycero-D-manno-heptose 1,7-bisphosphate phosphatase